MTPSRHQHTHSKRSPISDGKWSFQALVAAWLCGTVAGVAEVNLAPSAPKPPSANTAVVAPTVEQAETNNASIPVIGSLYVLEYRVKGSHLLKQDEIGEAVYPYLGPGRTEQDIEQARAALEKAYKDKGFQTCSVQVPPQSGKRGIIILEVTEAKIGRLRVHGSRYFSLDQIKKHAPSLAEGTVPNFNEVTRDIIALNQFPDRRITPNLKPGVEPGTYDIDLNVKDTLPLHGSIELNNRYSADTTELRLNGSLSYSNLWQRGHALGVSFQIAPERLDDAKVFSAYYSLRIPDVDWLSLMLLGTKQNSNVSTLGGGASAGRGEILGLHANITLPPPLDQKDFFHSINLGIDYKHFDEQVRFVGSTTVTPITYYPLSLNYSATWLGQRPSPEKDPRSITELNAGLNFGLRGTASDANEFDSKRFKADSNYIYFRGDLAHTQDLPGEWQAYAKVQGQIASMPLINNEQFSGGGLSTVRGYLESEALGDNGIFGSLELRTPNLLDSTNDKTREWRFYVFCEGGILTLREVLPEQDDRFELASIGVGSRIRIFDHFNGSLDAGYPLIDAANTQIGDLLLTFRLWADF